MIDLAEAGRQERDRPIADPTPMGVLARRAQRIRRRRVLAAAIPAAVMVIGAAIAVSATTTNTQRVVTGPGPSARSGLAQPAPPATPPGQPSIWLSVTQVPPSGAHLAAAVLNPTTTAMEYGVAGTFERWTGTAWVSAARWYTSLDFWGGFGEITPKDLPIPAIGLSAPPHGAGTVEYFAVPALPPGWYRVGHSGGNSNQAAYGVFRVVAGVPGPAPLDNPSGALMTAHPALVPPASGELQIVGYPGASISCNRCTAQPTNELDRFNQGLAATVELQRWDGSRWEHLMVLAVHAASPPRENTDAVAVTVPALEAGTYRLVRHSSAGFDLARVIWVTNSIP